MDPADVLKTISSPVLVWIAMGVMAVGMIANAFPKILGPVGTGIQEWAARRRAERAARDDADIADQARQIVYLESVAARERAEHATTRATWHAREMRWVQEWAAHRVWDRDMYELAIRLGAEPTPPPAPPFLSPDPIEEDQS